MLTLACLLTCAGAVQFDMRDPIASHPDMQTLVNGIVSRRRGLSNPSTLSQNDKNDILALHNKIRAGTARGEYQGSGAMMPQAKNMKKMQWSDDLANVATDWSENCVFDHRGQGPTDANGDGSCGEALETQGSSWTSCGENLYASGAAPLTWSTSNWGETLAIKQGIEDSWSIGEAANYVWDTRSSAGGLIGHYTQVVWANSEFLGCGFSQCSTNIPTNTGTFTMKNLFTCNYYPPGNYNGQDPYESGSTGSNCPSDYSTLSQDTYTDQDGNLYNLQGLCVSGSDTGTGSGTGTGTGTDTDNSDDTDCCPAGTSSNSACSASSSCSNSVCSEDSWCCNSGWDNICVGICTRLACSDGATDTAPAPTVPAPADGTCVKITGWSTTGYAGGFDAGTWDLYAPQPEEQGYPVYKWSEGEYYMYALGWDYNWYTIGSTIGAWYYALGYCNSGVAKGTNTPITDCDNKWNGGSNVNFYECGAEPLILSACLDDAAEFVRFLLDADDASDYMQFDLHSEVGCWADSDEPVWMHTTDDASLYYLHRDAHLREWQITSDLIEGDSVYQCSEVNVEDCTAGTWTEFYSPVFSSTAGTGSAIRTLDTATVEVSVSGESGAEESEGLTAVDDLAIVLVVLLIVAVVGVVALLWCRRSRAKGAVTFEPNDQEMGGVAQTAMVGDTVDVGTDEE